MMRRAWIGLQFVGMLAVTAAVTWMLATRLYRPTLLVGVLAGFVASAWFVAAHRPRFWWRLEAIGAAGLVAAMALLYGRQLVLLILTWPGMPPRSTGQALFSLVTLGVVDFVIIARLVVFKRFVRRDRAGLPQPGMAATVAEVQALLDRITTLEAQIAELRAAASGPSDERSNT